MLRNASRRQLTSYSRSVLLILFALVGFQRLAGKILLELIEVQTGSYFGEDDIIRIEDDYRRS